MVIVSGTITRCGFVALWVALLEEVCHHCGGFEVSYVQVTCIDTVYFLLPADQDVQIQLLHQHQVCLCVYMFHYDDTGMNI